jgi:hypothetical protein
MKLLLLRENYTLSASFIDKIINGLTLAFNEASPVTPKYELFPFSYL